MDLVGQITMEKSNIKVSEKMSGNLNLNQEHIEFNIHNRVRWKIHTSAATIAVLPEATDVDVEI